MQILFSLNDWPIKTLISLVFLVQFAIIVIIFAEEKGLQIPLLRPILIVGYLLFIPGFLILRILRINALGNTISVLYSLGFSILFVMLAGLAVNFSGPLIGISKPISEFPLLFTFFICIVVLSFLAFFWDDGRRDPIGIDVKYLFSSPVIVLLLLPLLSIIGTYLVNVERFSGLLSVLIFVIAVLILFSGFSKVIPQELWPLMILSISLSLLYHTSLIEMYIAGQDIHKEYFFSNLVISQGYWNPNIEANVNAMLSITQLNPILSILMNLDVGWVYKIVYPFIFSFFPLGLYIMYLRLFEEPIPDKNALDSKEDFGYGIIHKTLGPRLSLFAIMLLISFSPFFTEMLSLARQQVAELFLMLFLLLAITIEIPSPKREALGIAFIFGLIVSHYTLSWIYFGILILTWITLYVSDILSNEKRKKYFISMGFIVAYLLINLFWHFVIPASTLFRDFNEKYRIFYENLSNTFFQIQESQPASILTGGFTSFLHSFYKGLFGFFMILIVVGSLMIFIHLWFRSRCQDAPFSNEYRALALSNFMLLLSVFLLPSLNIFGISRIFHIVLIVLAPVAILGCIVILQFINRLSKTIIFWNSKVWIKIFSVFISIFIIFLFLFGTGIIYEMAKDNPASISLSQKSILTSGNLRTINQFYNVVTPEVDIFGVRWVSQHRESDNGIYAGLSQATMPLKSYGMIPNASILLNEPDIAPESYPPPKSYIFLGQMNNNYKIINGPNNPGGYWDIGNITPVLEIKGQIYSNGDATVYF